MGIHIYRFAGALFDAVVALPMLAAFVARRSIGRAYQVGPLTKLRLVIRFIRNINAVETLSSITEHVELAATLLRIAPEVRGDVVEAGCYVGGSSVNLSIACAMTGRRLLVYDSFQGLPPVPERDRLHHNALSGVTDEYWEGRFAATKGIVAANIAARGEISTCEFVPGFFDATMPDLDRPIVLAFLDVDLVSSLEPCIRGVWPQVRPGCRIYIHEARSLSLAAAFFATEWWRDQLGEEPPGLVGAGTGLPLRSLRGSELGYAEKGLTAVAELSVATSR